MLAELIIVSTIVITAMVGLYANFNRIYSLYKEKFNYYSIDGVYATKMATNSLMKDNFNEFVNAVFEETHWKYLIEDSVCANIGGSDSFNDLCGSIQKLYSVHNMIFIEYNIGALEEFKSSLNNVPRNKEKNILFMDYIDYLIRYYDVGANGDEYNYIVITELENILKDGNRIIEQKRYYSNLRIR